MVCVVGVSSVTPRCGPCNIAARSRCVTTPQPQSAFKTSFSRFNHTCQLSSGARALTVSYAASSDTDVAEKAAADDGTDGNGAAADEAKKSEEYTDVMQQRMGSSLTYRHEDGMNYARILDDLYVGSCLQTAADVDRLAKDEGIGTVFCLQMDSDMEYFDLDVKPIQQRCEEVGISHVRFLIRDFDPVDLRNKLPAAVKLLHSIYESGKSPVYIHCTAGLGRAPATALAYMYWMRGFTLQDAFETLRAVRPCNPRLQSIRQATADLLYGGNPIPVSISVSRTGFAKQVQVAGLDVGWGQQVDLEWDNKLHRFSTTRMLQPGRYQYKLIVDGHWTYSADHPTLVDGGNINNYVDVEEDGSNIGRMLARRRLLSEDGTMTDGERAAIIKKISS